MRRETEQFMLSESSSQCEARGLFSFGGVRDDPYTRDRRASCDVHVALIVIDTASEVRQLEDRSMKRKQSAPSL